MVLLTWLAFGVHSRRVDPDAVLADEVATADHREAEVTLVERPIAVILTMITNDSVDDMTRTSYTRSCDVTTGTPLTLLMPTVAIWVQIDRQIDR